MYAPATSNNPIHDPISELNNYLDVTKPPRYTFALFQNAEMKLEEMNKRPNTIIQNFDIDNVMFTDPQSFERRKIMIRSLHDVAYRKSAGPSEPNLKGSLIDFVEDKQKTPISPCCGNVTSCIPRFQTTVEKWRDSVYMKALVQHLEKHAPNMERVDTIIGYGLGCLAFQGLDPSEIEPWTEHPQRVWLQHLTCHIIKNVLERVQGTAGRIKIYAQDPEYCPNCISLLGGQGITASNSPTKYLAQEALLNKHTFVVSKAPTAPIRQVVFDLTADCGGPAGILCDKTLGEEDEDTKSPRQETTFADPPSDRWCEYVHKNHGRCLAFDDSEEPGDDDYVWGEIKVKGPRAVYRGKECSWSVFEDARIYLKERSG